MEQYIKKSALVAEIKRRMKVHMESNHGFSARYDELKDILSFLDTLEVKEVDCEREIGIYTTKELLKKRNHSTGVFHLTQTDINSIAKHFFELGLKAKGE